MSENQTKKPINIKQLSLSMIKNQRRNSLRRNMNSPIYSLSEFREWLYAQNIFFKLYDDWVYSNFCKKLKPSVDRIDDSKGYSFDNIQLMTWEENNKKANKDMRSGKLIHGHKPQKPVRQYNLDGVFIEQFVSISEAARQLGIKYNTEICKCCKGKKKSTGGFAWEYV